VAACKPAVVRRVCCGEEGRGAAWLPGLHRPLLLLWPSAEAGRRQRGGGGDGQQCQVPRRPRLWCARVPALALITSLHLSRARGGRGHQPPGGHGYTGEATGPGVGAIGGDPSFSSLTSLSSFVVIAGHRHERPRLHRPHRPQTASQMTQLPLEHAADHAFFPFCGRVLPFHLRG